MPKTLIKATWTFESPLHVGAGLSRPAYADSIVRRSSSGRAEIDGEEIKGAIRHAAERLCSWFVPMPAEDDQSSAPAHPVLQRIFSNSGRVRYRFRPAAAADVADFRAAATAMEPDSGVALTETLRVIENYAAGAVFDITIEATGPVSDVQIENDRRFLICSLVVTESLGGKRTVGLGRIACSNVHYMVDGVAVAVAPETAAGWVQTVKEALEAEPVGI